MKALTVLFSIMVLVVSCVPFKGGDSSKKHHSSMESKLYRFKYNKQKRAKSFSRGLAQTTESDLSTCLERFYSRAHLKKQKGKQEVRSVQVAVDNYKPFEEDQKIQIKIHFQRNSKNHLAYAEGTCRKTRTYKQFECNLNGQGYDSAKVTVSESRGSDLNTVLFRVIKNFKYKNISPNAQNKTIQITNHDVTFKVFTNPLESLWGRRPGCGDTFNLVHHKTVARLWNEVALESVRNDLARPTVTARNLMHLSALMWDVYAAYDKNLKPYYLKNVKAPSVNDKNNARDMAMSYAAHTFLSKRFEKAPGNGDIYPISDGEGVGDGEDDHRLHRFYDRILKKQGYFFDEIEKENPHAIFGIRMAKNLLRLHLDDGSREKLNYAPEENYKLKNQKVVDISQSGLRLPIDISKYNENTHFMVYERMQEILKVEYFNGDNLRKYISLLQSDKIGNDLDIDHWVKLYIPGSIDQNGNSQISAQEPLTVFWGGVPTFSDLSAYKSKDKEGVYFDPGEYLPSFSKNKDEMILKNLEVIKFSSMLSPLNLKGHDFDGDGREDLNPGAKKIYISPNKLGNNTLGTNDGTGHKINPYTKKRYKDYKVKAADYYRSIAEFWADGPDSETPPGHWNTLANKVMDRMEGLKVPFKWRGTEANLSREEYELKLYLALNGALHDAAVVAWGIKGHYQGNRPVTVIRKLATMAEEDSEFADKLISMAPDYLKMITFSYPQSNADKVSRTITKTKLAVKAWRGVRDGFFYGDMVSGQLELRNLSFRDRSEFSIKEEKFYNDEFLAGVGWILADHWMPYQRQSFVTPPFPGFVSGHSTFSRAAAEVLTKVTGTQFFPGGMMEYSAPPLHFERNVETPFKFQWATYYDASDVSGISRIYGGIHASYDDLPARKIGSKIGLEAFKTADQFFRKR